MPEDRGLVRSNWPAGAYGAWNGWKMLKASGNVSESIKYGAGSAFCWMAFWPGATLSLLAGVLTIAAAAAGAWVAAIILGVITALLLVYTAWILRVWGQHRKYLRTLRMHPEMVTRGDF